MLMSGIEDPNFHQTVETLSGEELNFFKVNIYPMKLKSSLVPTLQSRNGGTDRLRSRAFS